MAYGAFENELESARHWAPKTPQGRWEFIRQLSEPFEWEGKVRGPLITKEQALEMLLDEPGWDANGAPV